MKKKVLTLGMAAMFFGSIALVGCGSNEQGTIEKAKEKATKVVEDASEEVGEVVDETVEKATSAGEEIIDSIGDTVSGMVDEVKEKAKAAIKGEKCGEGKCGEGKCGGE